MKDLLKVSEQTLWQLLGKATTSISTLILIGVITRAYGQEGTGIYTLS